MRQWTVRIGLSLMVVVGFWTNHLPAQGVLVVPEVPYEPGHPGDGYGPLGRRPLPPPSRHLAGRMMHSHGVGCGIDPFYVPCGNLWYELRFAFSSCREFFVEPCPQMFGNHHRNGNGNGNGNGYGVLGCSNGSCGTRYRP